MVTALQTPNVHVTVLRRLTIANNFAVVVVTFCVTAEIDGEKIVHCRLRHGTDFVGIETPAVRFVSLKLV